MSNEGYHSDELKEKVSNLPHKPGVYQYFDKDGTIIYVGKAKDLRKRVTSYFNRDRYESGKDAIARQENSTPRAHHCGQ